MTGEYQPREHDHLIEPMIHAVHGEGAAVSEAEDPSPPPISRVVAWAPLLVPLGGFAIAILVWAIYRMFQ